MTVSPAVSQCIYATNSTGGDGSGRVTIYSLNANGNAAPLATISGSETGLKNPQAVAVGDDHSIYVSNYPSSTISDSSITVYQAGASGDAAPVRTITGSDTGLSENYGLAVDRTGKVFVTETVTAPRVAVFDAGADNDEAPSRFFGLRPKARHTLDTSFWPVALDAAGKAYVGGADVCRCGNGADELLVYSKAAHHFQKPLQRIRGGKSQLTFPKGLAVDTSGNVYVANWPNTGQIYGSLLVFASGSNGGAAPM